MTKEEYFALICADPWLFPNVEGHPPPPAEWASEAWELEQIQNNVVYGMAREVSKTGFIGYGARLVSIAEVLTSDQVLRLFSTIRNRSPHRESEFRTEFEEGFPEHAPFLPSPVADSPGEIWLSDGRRIRFFGFTVDGTPVRVLIDTARITDWKSFHDVFADAFGFPEYYGCNLDAFFDCLSCLGSEESEMTKIQLPPDGVVVIELSDPADLKARCPGIYSGLVKTIGEINERREDRIVGVSIYPAGWTATVEGAEGVDWPPDVDTHGNKISSLATRVDELRPFEEYVGEDCPPEPDFEDESLGVDPWEQGIYSENHPFVFRQKLTKEDYFERIKLEFRAMFPYVGGFAPPPVEWVREVWEQQDRKVWFWISKVKHVLGELRPIGAVRASLKGMSQSLSTEQVVQIFLTIRDLYFYREGRFRKRFEAAFAEHATFLPPVMTREEVIAALKEDGLPDPQATWLAEEADQPSWLDSHASEIFANEDDEPLRVGGFVEVSPSLPFFNEDGTLTKAGFFHLTFLFMWDPDPFLNNLGYPFVPIQWAREAWELEEVQGTWVWEAAREVGKSGTFTDLTGQWAPGLSGILTTNQVIRFFQELRHQRGEMEYRLEFELSFPEHAPFLPEPYERHFFYGASWDHENFGFQRWDLEERMIRILIDTRRITDLASFYDVFAEAFGFPSYFQPGLDAIFNYLLYLDKPTFKMTTVHARRNGLVLIELTDPADFKARCPRLYTELLKIIGEINARHLRRRILAMSIYPARWTATVEGAEGVDWPPDVDVHGNKIFSL